MYIYAYNNASGSVSQLKIRLPGVKILKKDGSRYVGSPDKKVLNWGNSISNPEISNSDVLNKPESVKLASNKLSFFQLAKETGINVPDFTNDQAEAFQWLQEGQTVFSREILNGSSGEGIVILDNLVSWNAYDHSKAKLYVKYIPKKDEFRVHVFNGEVIDVQRKSVERGFTPNDWRIRNHRFGFIFTRNNANPAPSVKEEALKAIQHTGLDFGAVDIVFNVHRNAAYVLEVNTAPGLEGTTLDKYAEKIADFFG